MKSCLNPLCNFTIILRMNSRVLCKADKPPQSWQLCLWVSFQPLLTLVTLVHSNSFSCRSSIHASLVPTLGTLPLLSPHFKCSSHCSSSWSDVNSSWVAFTVIFVARVSLLSLISSSNPLYLSFLYSTYHQRLYHMCILFTCVFFSTISSIIILFSVVLVINILLTICIK